MRSTDNAPARPPQATFAAWLVILCSAYVVLSSIEALGSLTSLTARTAAEELLDQTPSLGLSVDQFLDLRRGTTIAAAVLAGVAGVLAFFAWRHDVMARRVLGVVAVPLFAVGIINSSMSTMLIAVATILLWREPVASWFAGRPAPELTPRGLFALGQGANGPTGRGPNDEGGKAADWTATPGVGQLGEAPRPRQATLAAVITWIFGTLSIVLAIASAAVLAINPDLVWDEMVATAPELEEQGVSQGMLQGVGITMMVLMVALAVATIVCAMGLLQRRKWGALGLIALCWFITIVCAMGLLYGQLALVLPGLAAVWVISLVRSRETRVWVLTAPRPDGSGPGQFADQAPLGQHGQFPDYPLPPRDGSSTPTGAEPTAPPVAPPAAPEGSGRRRADVPLDAPSQSTQETPRVPEELNPHHDREA